MTGVFWGRASDRFGRKPVILVGLLCTMLASIFLGFSQNLSWAIVARGISGSVNGNVGILRTAVAELVPQKQLQPKAFSIMPLIWTIGSILGPALGGTLANPVARYPRIFGNSEFFSQFPFALPNLVASFFFLVGLSAGILFLRETLEARKFRRDYGLIIGELLASPFKKHITRRERHQGSGQSTFLLKHSPVSSFSTTEDVDEAFSRAQVQPRAKLTYREVSYFYLSGCLLSPRRSQF